MIKTFANKETAAVLAGLSVKRLPKTIVSRGKSRLEQLDSAARIEDLRLPPSNHLETLSGNREGQWSIRINRQWRVCFRFAEGNAYDVEIVDYH